MNVKKIVGKQEFLQSDCKKKTINGTMYVYSVIFARLI